MLKLSACSTSVFLILFSFSSIAAPLKGKTCTFEAVKERILNGDLLCYVDSIESEELSKSGLFAKGDASDAAFKELMLLTRPCKAHPKMTAYQTVALEALKLAPEYMVNWACRVDTVFIEGPNGKQSNASAYVTAPEALERMNSAQEMISEAVSMGEELTQDKFHKMRMLKYDVLPLHEKSFYDKSNMLLFAGINEKAFKLAVGSETKDQALSQFLSFYRQFRIGKVLDPDLKIGGGNKYVVDPNGPKVTLDMDQGIQGPALILKLMMHEFSHHALIILGMDRPMEIFTLEMDIMAGIFWDVKYTPAEPKYTPKTELGRQFQSYICADTDNDTGSIVSGGGAAGECQVPNVGLELEGNEKEIVQKYFDTLMGSGLVNWLSALNPREEYCEVLSYGYFASLSKSYVFEYPNVDGSKQVVDMKARFNEGGVYFQRLQMAKDISERAGREFLK